MKNWNFSAAFKNNIIKYKFADTIKLILFFSQNILKCWFYIFSAGVIYAIANCLANFSGMLAPLVTGYITDVEVCHCFLFLFCRSSVLLNFILV